MSVAEKAEQQLRADTISDEEMDTMIVEELLAVRVDNHT